MNGVIIFWLFTFTCLGAVIGGAIERWLSRRSKGTARATPVENKLAKEGDLEVLQAWRTPAGKVWLEMDGTRLEDKSALQTDQQRRLLNLVLDLRPWLGTASAGEPNPAAKPAAVESASPAEKKKVQPADEKAKPAPVMKTIVEQINDVLQAKLATSVFKDRGIELTEGPGGAVMVKDGFKQFEGIDSVTDPEVKALIRQSVADWEKSTK